MNGKKEVILLSEPSKPVPGSKMGPWEKDEIIETLAFTDNIRETARRTGRSLGVVHKLLHENIELILQVRGQLGRTLQTELAATALEVQQTIRHLLAQIRETGDPALAVLLAPATFDLAKTGAISAERYSLLAEAAQKIEPAGVATAEEREADKAYLRDLVRDLLKEEREGERREVGGREA